MRKVEIDSEELKRGIALQYLKSHKRQQHFELNSSVDPATLGELKKRGCKVILDSAGCRYTISSHLPLGQLVTRVEWRQDRWELAKGFGLLLGYLTGYLVVVGLAVGLKMGIFTGALWLLGWKFIWGAAFPDYETKEKIKYVVIGLLFFWLGVVTKLVGWSTEW